MELSKEIKEKLYLKHLDIENLYIIKKEIIGIQIDLFKEYALVVKAIEEYEMEKGIRTKER